jgi:NhaP-type Na+/H+ or K+/H+ antiporter
LILIALLLISLLSGYVLQAHDCKLVNETVIATLTGLALGALLKTLDSGSEGTVMRAHTEFFLFLILPSVIFESSFSLDNPLSFKELGGSMTFGFLGTLISTSLTGLLVYLAGFLPYVKVSARQSMSFLASLAFGALISATDSSALMRVTQSMQGHNQLCALIFGGSLFNDAVSIILFHTFISLDSNASPLTFLPQVIWQFSYNFLISLVIGVVFAMAVSFTLKQTDRTNPTNRLQIEASAVVFGPWVCYLITEACSFSGLVSILFCGMVMTRYTLPNLSPLSRVVIGKAYSAYTHAAATLVFVFLGLGLFSFDLSFHTLGLGLFLAGVLSTWASQACSVMSCSALLNCFRSHKISPASQLVMWVATPRGAIAFALSIKAQQQFGHEGEAILVFTLLYSALSVSPTQVCLVGACLVPLLNHLPKSDEYDERVLTESTIDTTSTCAKHFKTKIQVFEFSTLYPVLVEEDVAPSETKLEALDLELVRTTRNISHRSECSRVLQELEFMASSEQRYETNGIQLS